MIILPGVEQHLTDDDFATLASGSPVADRVRQHLAACGDCHREADELRRTDVYILAGIAGDKTVGEHIGGDDLLAFVTEAVTGAEALALTRHLASCPRCRRRYDDARAEEFPRAGGSLQRALARRRESLMRRAAPPEPPDFGTVRIMWRGRSSQIEHLPPPGAPAHRSIGRFVELGDGVLALRLEAGEDPAFPQLSLRVAEGERALADCPVALRAPSLDVRVTADSRGRAVVPLNPGTAYVTVGVPVRGRFSLVVERER